MALKDHGFTRRDERKNTYSGKALKGHGFSRAAKTPINRGLYRLRKNSQNVFQRAVL
jgi:hypothetical protein